MPRIGEYPAATGLSDDDLLVVVDDPAGTPATKKVTAVTARSFFAGMSAAAGDGYQLASLPNLAAALTDYNDVTTGTVAVVGIGSSVGLGNTMTSPTTDAPNPYLATALAGKVNKLGNVTFSQYNGSAGGHAMANAPADYTSAKGSATGTVRLVTIAMGMNDGTTDLYHNGQTLPGVRTFLASVVAAIRADHADPVVLTTPHPHTGRQTWTPSLAVIYPASGNTGIASDIVTITTAAGASVPCSYRHLRVNDLIRRTCADLGVTCIDVERYWFEGVAAHGEDALFDVGESVHPNDLGHQVSYHAAIDHWAAGLDTAKVVATTPPTAQITHDEKFNVQIASPVTAATLVDKQYATLLVRARHPAFPTHHAELFLVVGDEGPAARVQSVSKIAASGPTNLVTVSISGAGIVLTAAIDGTDIAWTLTNGYPLP